MKINEEIPKIMSNSYKMKEESRINNARYEFEKHRFFTSAFSTNNIPKDIKRVKTIEAEIEEKNKLLTFVSKCCISR